MRALLAANAGALDLEHVRSILRELEQALDRGDLVSELDSALADLG